MELVTTFLTVVVFFGFFFVVGSVLYIFRRIKSRRGK